MGTAFTKKNEKVEKKRTNVIHKEKWEVGLKAVQLCLNIAKDVIKTSPSFSIAFSGGSFPAIFEQGNNFGGVKRDTIL